MRYSDEHRLKFLWRSIEETLALQREFLAQWEGIMIRHQRPCYGGSCSVRISVSSDADRSDVQQEASCAVVNDGGRD